MSISVVVTWNPPTQSWIAVSLDPPGRAIANGPRTAVNRLHAIVGRKRKLQVAVELPAEAEAAAERYRLAAEDLARRQSHVVTMQLDLARRLIDSCGMNRSEAAVAVGMSNTYLGKLLDGKAARAPGPPPPDPCAALSAFVADERIGVDRYRPKPKVRKRP